MRIVKGRGNSRTVYLIPTGEIVRNAEKKEQEQFIGSVMKLLLG